MFHMLSLPKYFSNYTDREGTKTLLSMGSIGFLNIVSFLKSDADSFIIHLCTVYRIINSIFWCYISEKCVPRDSSVDILEWSFAASAFKRLRSI